MKEIFGKLIKASTAKEVTTILENLIDDFDVSWIPVGGKADNIATINMGTDPAAGLTERITNAIDAVLELEWHKQGKPTDIKTPRMAAQQWFNIPYGKLSYIENASDKNIQDLSKKIRVTLLDSEKENHPTVEIRDKGIGLTADQFKSTILSLHGGNKLHKLYLMGAYGQGGSTALSFSNYTIIISKPSLGDNENLGKVSFTIVRINQGDINFDKQPWYEYCVDQTTQQPFTLAIDDKSYSPGTLVRHIGMDLNKYTAKITGPTNSLWYLAHHFMFDAVLPYTISGERQKDLNKETEKVENRIVLGNNRRLSRGGGDDKELTQYKREATLTFRDGKVTIYYWVLTLEGEKPWDRIKNYTLASQPIIITFNGQKQGYLPNYLIKNDLKLPFLEKYLIVQIECDGLDNESKRHLFSTTRESLRDTSILEELKKITVDTLNADDNLQRLDKERKDRYLKKDETEAIDKLRKRLASRINAYLKGSGSGNSVRASSTSDYVKPNMQPAIPISDTPTFIEITSPDGKEVYIGKSFSVKFKTDAHPNLFNNPDTFFAVAEPHSLGSFTGSARVIDGYGIAFFKSRDDVEDGTKASVILELRPPRQRTLSDSIEVIAAPAPNNADSNTQGDKGIPNIEIIPCSENDPYYKEHDWNYNSVADVATEKDAVFIYINDSNRHLTKLIERAQRHSTEAVESIKNRYREHISFCAFMIDQNKAEERLKQSEEETLSTNQIETIKKADMENACETICGMISDFFEFIKVETQEINEFN
jgi:hypothetical protein